MPPPPPKQNTRRKRTHHKVLTGCDTCKLRRIKCDETKPSCRQCEKANTICPGYHPPQARIYAASNSTRRAPDAPSVENSALSLATRHCISDVAIELGTSPDLRIIWQTALLDLFLVQWLPANIARDEAVGTAESRLLFMSGWPTTAWKLGKNTNDSLLAHSLLCLVLCLLGLQTGNTVLVREATRHYARVLALFQQQVLRLEQGGDASRHDASIASLVAAGYSCAQIEYVLGSWNGADQHLYGVASIFQSCGPSWLMSEDTRKVFLDHCLLWTSCCVGSWLEETTIDVPGLLQTNGDAVHRTPRKNLIFATKSRTCHACQCTQHLVTVASNLPALLEEYDASLPLGARTEMLEYMQRFSDIVSAIEELCISAEWRSTWTQTDMCAIATKSVVGRHTHDTLENVLMAGYSSSFILHALAAMHEIASCLEARFDERTATDTMTRIEIRLACEKHADRLFCLVDELLITPSAMVMNPCLFFVDSAWVAYKVIRYDGEIQSTDRKPWFIWASQCMTKQGFKPLREPWNYT